MLKTQRYRPKSLSFNKMIPNILTMLALSSGMTAVYFGLEQNWRAAVWAIFVAAVFDGLDGRVARLLKGTSKFGAELDSLSDLLSFGVAPALILYLWSLSNAGHWAWVVTLLFIICCALRLARFNTMLDEPPMPPWAYNFFVGVPAPAGAALGLLPLIFWLEFKAGFLANPVLVAIHMIVVGGLMVSRLPTFSFKKVQISYGYVLPTMLGAGLLVALLVTEPWVTLGSLLVIYMASIPLAWRSFGILKRRADERHGGGETAETDGQGHRGGEPQGGTDQPEG